MDVENVAPHYEITVQRWLARFRARSGSLDPERYDRRFIRMWEYYFGCCIAGCRASDSAVYQVLFTKAHSDPTRIPLHRV
jgi:cyclopropane-fatty-acyl-phospholipid synthase